MTESLAAVRPTSSRLTWRDYADHVLARWSIRRMEHRVEPGLYALGNPTPDSRVFVTANYTLSFDALRSALAGVDAYILVLDTQGVNVWCAAGKRTFSTEELLHRIEVTNLKERVKHRVLILPQLGAPGVAAHIVRKESGFKVEYGPVRASDLPVYLKTHTPTPEMRRVSFNLRDRLVLIPVELVYVLVPALIAAIAGFLIGGWIAAAAIISSVLAGTVLFPLLLPWLPTHAFSTKGLVLGALVALPFASLELFRVTSGTSWLPLLQALGFILALAPVTAFLALNFTGSTTFTSKTGVRREIFAYIPLMAWLFGAGIVLTVAHASIRMLGGS